MTVWVLITPGDATDELDVEVLADRPTFALGNARLFEANVNGGDSIEHVQ